MRVNAFFLPLVTLSFLLGSVWVTQATGMWSTSGREAIGTGALTPADIKGWMTLQQVADGLNVPLADLYALANLPTDLPPTTALKDLEKLVEGFETSLLRDRLAAWQAAPPAAPTPMPTPTSPALLATPHAPTGVGGNGAGTGTGDGTGPTPLPAGQVLPASQIKGRHTLADISTQCAVPFDTLLTALALPADTPPTTQVKTLFETGPLTLAEVQARVAALKP